MKYSMKKTFCMSKKGDSRKAGRKKLQPEQDACSKTPGTRGPKNGSERKHTKSFLKKAKQQTRKKVFELFLSPHCKCRNTKLGSQITKETPCSFPEKKQQPRNFLLHALTINPMSVACPNLERNRSFFESQKHTNPEKLSPILEGNNSSVQYEAENPRTKRSE